MASVRIAAFFAAILCVGLVQSDESKPIEIPLKKVRVYDWSHDSGDSKHSERPIGYKAGPAFAAQGTESEAIHAAQAVVVKGWKPVDSFSEGSDIWLVFFTEELGPFVELTSVERSGNEFTICYRFVPHETEVTRQTLAVIPVGQLPVGKYHVTIENVPMEKRFRGMGPKEVRPSYIEQVICKPFDFKIVETHK